MIEKYVDLNPKNADDGTQLDIKVSQVPLNLTRAAHSRLLRFIGFPGHGQQFIE